VRDTGIAHLALDFCFRIVFCGKPVSTFPHDALESRLAHPEMTDIVGLGVAADCRAIGGGAFSR
jgi:hypothetical protein